MATKTPVSLPTLAEIELADGKLGSLLSDLDQFESMLEKARNEPKTVEEYLANPDAFGPVPVNSDIEALLRLFVFCQELASDGQQLSDYATKLQHLAFEIYIEEYRDSPAMMAVQSAAMSEWRKDSGGGDA